MGGGDHILDNFNLSTGYFKSLKDLETRAARYIGNRRKIAQRMIESAIKSKEQRKCNSKIIDNFEKKKDSLIKNLLY